MFSKVTLLCLACGISQGFSFPVDDLDTVETSQDPSHENHSSFPSDDASRVPDSADTPLFFPPAAQLDAPSFFPPAIQLDASGAVPPVYNSPPPADAIPTTAVEIITVTEVITVAPTTDTVTVAPPPSPSSTSSPPDAPTPTCSASPSSWTSPQDFADLSCFNVIKFPSGKRNLAIVSGIPAAASAAAPTPTSSASPMDPTAWSNDSSVFQLFYPAGSINPSNKPQGGSEFYAKPLDLSAARNVTFEYSVFFPVDFDWVKGGKLPGLYGGHTTCSGGDDALNCFSTRMMWRPDGAGELYLYAPKDKQTNALCSLPPQSVCDSTYGLSIGRGSFTFKAGAWTHISQTVILNTPGVQDGGFFLVVNSVPVITRSDVFYRNEAPPDNTEPAAPDPEEPSPTQMAADGLLDPLVDGVLGTVGHIRRLAVDMGSLPLLFSAAVAPLQALTAAHPTTTTATVTTTSVTTAAAVTQTIIAAAVVAQPLELPFPLVAPFEIPDPAMMTASSADSVPPGPVTFSGVFFSTFFGGHEQNFATPRDQWVWFKDFAVTVNDAPK